LHNGTNLACKSTGRGLLLEFEGYIRKALLLLEDPFLRRSFSKERDVLEEDFDDLFVILEAVFGEADLTVEDTWRSRTNGICTFVKG
jgi:hypothetical protein